MFYLWYLKEAYSKYRNNAPNILKIRVMVAEQFMKMFQNCAIARNGAMEDELKNLNYKVKLKSFNILRITSWAMFFLSLVRSRNGF